MNTNKLTSFRPSVVYGNPVVKKQSKNDEVKLSREYGNESSEQRIERILAMPLHEKKKGGEK